MKIDIFDIDKMVKLNELKEVTNTISLNVDGLPTDDGLFSFTIFGKPASKERKLRYAYIDLGTEFIHPLVFKNLITLQRNLGDLILGKSNFVLDSRKRLVPSDSGNTGIDFLKKVWDSFIPGSGDSEEGSSTRKERVKFIKNISKKEAFMSKWLIVPAFYRDINFQSNDRSRIGKDEINDSYAKLIGLTKAIKQGGGFELTAGVVKSSIQLTINQVFDYFQDKISSKKGVIKDKLLAKTVDYSVRSVITCAEYNSSTFDTVAVKMNEIGIPIAQVCILFYPFIVRELYNGLSDELEQYSFEDVHEDAYLEFLPKEIEKIVSRFIKDKNFRKEGITFRGKKKGDRKVFKKLIGDKNITWLEYIYMKLTTFTLPNRYTIVTRYPMDNYQNLIIAKVKVLTTIETIKYGKFNFYPDLNSKKGFYDAAILANHYLSTMGADFDGDTISIRSVFSNEANKELDKIIHKKINILGSTAGAVRDLKNEGILGLYSLTK